MTAVRIVTVDYYLSSPIPNLDMTYSEFRTSKIKQVPVLQIFGAMNTGEKTCLHVHGVFPYVYIPYDGSEPPEKLSHKLALQLDHSLNVSLGQNDSNTQHVCNVALVSGIPFYGYHAQEHQFFKIFFYSPFIVQKACSLLENGVLGKIYQPHECHINYVLQFMIDYNLHGMSFINLSSVKYRGPQNDVPQELVLPESVERRSTSRIEIDALASDILNRLEIISGNLTVNPGLAALWADERQRRRNKDADSQISFCLTQDRGHIEPTSTHQFFRERFLEKMAIEISNNENVLDPNRSVYPVETPENLQLLSASSVTGDALDISTMELKATDRSEDDTLLNVLQDLHDQKNNEQEILDQTERDPIETDSILSQIDQEDEDVDDLEQEKNLLDDSFWNDEAVISQINRIDFDNLSTYNLFVDGPLDSSTSEEEQQNRKPKRKNKTVEHKRRKIEIISSSSSSSSSSFEELSETEMHTVKKKSKKSSCKSPVKYKKLKVVMISPTKKDENEFKTRLRSKSVPNRNVLKENKLSQTLNKLPKFTKLLTGSKPCDDTPKSISIKPLNLNDNDCMSCSSKQTAQHTNSSSSSDSDENLQTVNKTFIINKSKNLRVLSTAELQQPKEDEEDEEEEEPVEENTFIEGGIVEADTVNVCSEISRETKTEKEVNDSIAYISDSSKSDQLNQMSQSELYDMKTNFFPQPCISKSYPGYIDPTKTYMPLICRTLPTFIDPKNDAVLSQNQLPASDPSEIDEPFIIMPKYHAPTRLDVVMTLDELNIPENQFLEPFYSKPGDVTKKIQVGHNVLKVPGRTVADVEEFQTSFGFSMEAWRKEKFQMLNPSQQIGRTNFRVLLAGHCQCILTPAIKAPTSREIEDWLLCRDIMKSDQDCDMRQSSQEGTTFGRVRLHVPCSPGHDDDDDDSQSDVTMSPCSPVAPQQKKVATVHPFLVSQEKTPSTSSIQDDDISTSNSKESISPSLFRRKRPGKGNLQKKALLAQFKSESPKLNDSLQISGPSLNNTCGFRMSFENLQNARAVSENQYLTIMVVEIHTSTRGDYNPNPEDDSVRAIFYSIHDDVPSDDKQETGVLVVNTLPGSPVKDQKPILDGIGYYNVTYYKSELELLLGFVDLIKQKDPDICVGYEIEMLSWGYLIERCNMFSLNLVNLISRVTVPKKSYDREISIPGRIVLDLWRLLRHEIALQSYTFENIAYHVLHQRIPKHSFKNLSLWWNHRSNVYRRITLQYYLLRVQGILKILDQLDLIGRTSELARLFGIQFFQVLSRGSQFRVESMMLRLAKPMNFVLVSPNVQQRAKMRAPESLPLIMEPRSRLYVDPVIVLDFQSLYPSIIIAYNYCFSTCVGRVEKLVGPQPFEFGATQLTVSRKCLEKIKDHISFSPVGIGFVTSEIQRGILPRMLQEILETRLMVKASMKENKDEKLLQRVLHSRQLGLKLIANVTYGYTAANFSGRMPCIEVGDSVVSKGRETLERAIKLIEKTSKWNAQVVYGDTDSLFVLVPGRTKEDAFRIGAEIAEAVTNNNPPPVKLKLEKVFQPCILQTKKRYVGYMYESPEQTTPEYCAKGIETVRRDGCPAVAKILEKSIRLLFETKDVSLIKQYVCRQFDKLLTGRASIQDLIFAREYRGASGYRPGACVPALELTKKWVAIDKRKEPRRSERVPYIIVSGPPGLPIIRLVRSPYELLSDSSLRPNAVYYITRVIIPPLNRCLNLIGVDAHVWFNEMPRKLKQQLPSDPLPTDKPKKSTISQYFATINCPVCSHETHTGLCESCISKPQMVLVTLHDKLKNWEAHYKQMQSICDSCCSRSDDVQCISLDCPVLYRTVQARHDLKGSRYLRKLIKDIETPTVL